MGITISLPADTKTPGSAGHTADHNSIVDAVTTAFASAANTAGDTFSGLTEFDGGVLLGTASPSTPASGKSVLYTLSTGVPTAKLDSAYAGAISLGSPADFSANTATATSATDITAAWSIPAGDANAGTLYRMTFAGFGAWGSTAQALTMNARVSGSTVMAGGGTGQVQSGVFAASTGIYVRGVVELLIVTSGSGGTATIYQEITLTARATLLPGTAANNVVTTINSNSTSGGTLAFNSTLSHTLAMSAAWASTTGAPTITGTQSYLERLGA